jgi:hypothetical protein
MIRKREIGTYRWEDKRDEIIYRIHRYSDGTSRYEQIGRLGSKTKRPIKRGPGNPRPTTKKASSTQKGRRFETEVFDLVRKAVDNRFVVQGDGRRPIVGAAGPWRADIAITEPATLVEGQHSKTLGPVRAVIECKSLAPSVSPGSYETGLARGYALLNDVGIGNDNVRLFMVFNRNPAQGETPRDTRTLFDKIGAQFINFEDESERSRFKREIATLRIHSKR